MNRPLTATAVSALLVAALTGCGSDDGTDPSEWGTGEVVGASPAATPDADSDGDTISKSALSAEQTTLHAEMILFEDVAKAKASEGSGGGGVSASFRESDDEEGRWLERPDGIRLAKDYTITWSNGKLTSYQLKTDQGEQMTYEAGRISVDVAVDTPRDGDLERSARQLERAVADWVAKHGKPPSVSDSSGGITLAEGFFSESDIAEVEVPFEGDISMVESFSANDEYTVHLRSDDTQENATLTQDGLTFSRPFEIV